MTYLENKKNAGGTSVFNMAGTRENFYEELKKYLE